MSRARKNIAIFLLKALVTVACLWWLSRYFDFAQVRAALAGINPLLLVVAIVLHFLSFVAGGVRWWLLFRHLQRQHRLSTGVAKLLPGRVLQQPAAVYLWG